MQLMVNGQPYLVDEERDRLLLWVLRDELGLTGTKFGCGIGLCGSCTVHLDGIPTRACITLLSAADGKEVRTLEGLAEIGANGEMVFHPVQQAFLDEQVPQCSWCMSGQMMTAAALLEKNPKPNAEEIRQAMDAVYCRCGTYHRIRKAVARAAELAGQSRSQLG
ncbi:MAG: Isoquinoline 1-oxidoreductase alpha subunit [Chloroflexi bacterium]|nr:Isoquinoline 1-oxidoreductase alpha subunit [Chloroflexota bacterium]